MNRTIPIRWLGGAVLGSALVCSALPAVALPAPAPAPSAPAAETGLPPAVPEQPAPSSPTDPANPAEPAVPTEPGWDAGTEPGEGLPSATQAPEPLSTVPDQPAGEDAQEETLAEAAGPLGARMGQGLERLLETGDPQVPTTDEVAERLEAETSPEIPEQVPDLTAGAGVAPASAENTGYDVPFRAVTGTYSGEPLMSLAADWMPGGIQGLDVSSHQGNVNWSSAWNQGGRFAYVKATEGTYYKNPYYSQQYNGSANAAMVRGAYHFAIPSPGSAASEANYFVDNGGGWTADGRTLPPLLDIEYNPYPQLGNTCYDMSAGQMVTWIQQFSDTIKSRTGRVPMIYTTTDWWRTCTGNTSAFSNHPLHLASYSQAGPGAMPSGWNTYDVWQYSSTGPFVGDSNVWRGSAAELARFVVDGPPLDRTRKTVSPGDFNGDGKSDLLTRRADGTLWFHAGTGNGVFAAPRKIGSGWEIYDSLAAVGDYDGDGRNDIVVRHVNGSLYRYSGTGVINDSNEGYRPAVMVGNGGWGQFNRLVGVGDADGDGRNDVLATRPDGSALLYRGTGTGLHGPGYDAGSDWWRFTELVGTGDYTGDGAADVLARSSDGHLWLRTGNGSGSFAPGFSIGSGWNVYSTVLAGDFNGDGQADLAGLRPDNSVWFYPGTGSVQEGYGRAAGLGTVTWAGDRQTIATRDFNGDGNSDLLTIAGNGILWFHGGKASGGFSPATNIGSGWQVYTEVTSVGDFDGDGRNDLLARRHDGTLWFYPGTGRVTATDEGYGPAVRIGSGWSHYTQVLGAGDLNGDGKNDLLARDTAGDLWRYYGTGSVSARGEGYTSGTRIGQGGWNTLASLHSPGDYDGDGGTDLMATAADGRLLLYRGNGKGLFGVQETVGTGWNAYSRVLILSASAGMRPELSGVDASSALWKYAGTGMQQQGYGAASRKGALPAG